MLSWLQQSWAILVAVIGGITLVWNFCNKTLKEIKVSANEPFKIIEEKLDKVDEKVTNVAEVNDLTKQALLTMQRNSLLRSCNEFLSRGYASMAEKSTISDQYISYHNLGGDSFITDMVEQVKDLPLKAEVIDNRKEE